MWNADRMSSPPWERDDRDVVRAMFDDDADAYDRSRPVAPGSVFDDLVATARLPPDAAIVEIGAGTGQATRPLAERGLRITALELGAHLAARASRTWPPSPAWR